jgi:hypothetical protein
MKGPLRNNEEIERIISAFAAMPNGSILRTLDLITLTHRNTIIAERHRLPAIYGLRAFAKRRRLNFLRQ